MSRISQYNANGLVKFLLKKRDEEVNKAKKELGDYVEQLAYSRIPTTVISLYREHPKYLKTACSVQVSGFGFEYKTFSTTNYFPSQVGSNFQVVLVEGEVERLRILDHKYEDLLKEKKLLSDELLTLIFSLRTYRKILEVIPESKQFLQELGSISLVPAVNSDVTSILNRLK
jgi:hypothetical protein